ncbi:hypothetical protein EJ377_05935 [Chryseobacterium arthrosphaerae]|uniref:Uncharacterized protein n=1 Tax=Chryseobacterium arthrosphaerae TaxID=651561 RepID=A0A432DZV4_9FLAO|nr:hypothetical protein EJ377_05935 [Chryseobacterium arthrosphaerae]
MVNEQNVVTMLRKCLLINILLTSSIVFSQHSKPEIPIPDQSANARSRTKAINEISDQLKEQLIVGLGEGTHGTKEFNEIRSEISKDLLKKMILKSLRSKVLMEMRPF